MSSDKILNTQPCFGMNRYGKCSDAKCNFSHEECIDGDDCPYQFCGYHRAPHNKTLLYYFKLYKIEFQFYNEGTADFYKLYLEILGFENVCTDIRNAYETTDSIEEFSEALKIIRDRVDGSREWLLENNYPIEFTNPHVPVKYLFEKVIYGDPDQFDANVTKFFDGLDNEIQIAKDFFNKCAGALEEESYDQVEESYDEEFPALVSSA